jgi:hypothetical protein
LYGPTEVKVVTSFRFEGFSDPHDSAVLYVIETADGLKGTLIDGCGNLADPFIYKFIADVESGSERLMIN